MTQAWIIKEHLPCPLPRTWTGWIWTCWLLTSLWMTTSSSPSSAVCQRKPTNLCPLHLKPPLRNLQPQWPGNGKRGFFTLHLKDHQQQLVVRSVRQRLGKGVENQILAWENISKHWGNLHKNTHFKNHIKRLGSTLLQKCISRWMNCMCCRTGL